MPFCTYCGTQVGDQVAACPECGHPQPSAVAPRSDRSGLVMGLVIGGGALLVLVAIMIAIAVPTFLGARMRAQDRHAQSSLRNAVTAAKVLATDTGSYAGLEPGMLRTVEPSLFFVEGVPSDDPGVVSFRVDGMLFGATTLSLTGTCFAMLDELNVATHYGQLDTGNCVPEAFADIELNAGGW